MASPAATHRALAASGRLAVLRSDRSIWVVHPRGEATLIADSTAGAFGFPTWSPDGTRIAAVRTSPDATEIVVVDVESDDGGPPPSAVIFRSASVAPFYLSWVPDGQAVAFLASDAAGLALWIAPAAARDPAADPVPPIEVRRGAPLYFDWIGEQRLMAHIGGDAEAFVGEIDLAGAPRGDAFASPGSFRVADVSADARFVGFVRGSAVTGAEVVIAERDGPDVATMPIFGFAALDFGPVEPILAAIGVGVRPITPSPVSVGPLRLLDARSGDVRTLLDGLVAGFDWSPDGTMIAAVHVVTVDDGDPVADAGRSLAAAATERREVRLSFLDVASGAILSERPVDLGAAYVEAVLPYFDQYALSHRLWAPDGSSYVLPVVDEAGETHLAAFFPGGDEPVTLDGVIAFWSVATDR